MQIILIVFISLLVVALLSLICILFARKIKAIDKDKKRKIIGKRRNRKYVDFVNEHSLAIRAIKELNSKYQFSTIYPLIYKNCYDTTVNFENVSCKDYLIYQFHLDTLKVRRIIKSRNNNISKEIDYKSKVDLAKDKLGNFDVSIEDLNEEKLRNIESIVFNDLIEKVNTDFYAEVHLYLTRGRMHRVVDEKKELSLIPGIILSTSLLLMDFNGLRAGYFHLLVSQCCDSFRLKRKHLGWIGFRFLVPQGKKKPFLRDVLILESVLDLL